MITRKWLGEAKNGKPRWLDLIGWDSMPKNGGSKLLGEWDEILQIYIINQALVNKPMSHFKQISAARTIYEELVKSGDIINNKILTDR